MKIFLFLIFAFSCTNLSKESKSQIVSGKCEKEFKKVHLMKGQGIWQQVTQGTTTTASYLVTGLGYSTDFLVTYAGGTIVTVAICSPILMLESTAQNSSSSAGANCIGEVGGVVYKAMETNLGKKSLKETASWRCPNVDLIAEGLLKVASCYESEGELDKAALQRSQLKNSELFELCLSDSAKKKFL